MRFWKRKSFVSSAANPLWLANTFTQSHTQDHVNES
eukprot:CAMPEP_0204886816 /NCGR_PEP_ID=MMETSP1349-20130617/16268_1 /ASSEMBLY_ACC=CAM_ASM_000710 /TAXON_ID=215587 /ORGANISM="Aplanochytrium stocchinoi, Strain GSBS06" /LENGTH=35 /DNA_ID= /DNA_START= /DNA_END= /DNA_ORIENTATION=